MRTLAVDPWSNKCWFAIFENWELIHSEQMYMSDIEKWMWVDDKIFYFWNRVKELRKEFRFNKIVFEKAHAKYNAIVKISELVWVLRFFWAFYRCEEVEWFSTKTIKKFITWSWNAEKIDMMKKIKKMFKLKEVDEDQADAIWLWAYHEVEILWIELKKV